MQGLGLITCQGIRSHMPQLRVPTPWLKTPYAASKVKDPECCKTWCSQINKISNKCINKIFSAHPCGLCSSCLYDSHPFTENLVVLDDNTFFFLKDCVSWGILVLDQGLSLNPLQWNCQVLTTGPTGNSLCFLFFSMPGILIWLPRWLSGKKPTCQCRRLGFHPWVGKIPWRRKWQCTPVFLPGKSHGWRSLAGYGQWSCKRVRYNVPTKQQQHIEI